MDSHDTVVKRFAILVGINAYVDKPLKACVRDVRCIGAHLGRLIPGIDIIMLTAGRSAGDPEPIDPTESSMRWPTFKNVTTALDNVTSNAEAGDLVYIHFSGHGTREEPVHEFSNKSTGDLALVLLDEENKSAVKYLWGCKLAHKMKTLVDKKVAVTLVLDCCFSGAVYRSDDPEARFLPYDPEIGKEGSKEFQSLVTIGDNTSRHASMLPNWMINPDGYAILSACGPHEVAREPRFNGENRGALSSFLLKALDSLGAAARHKDIYDYVRANFKRYKIPQNPVLYGNKWQPFFAPWLSRDVEATVPVVEKGGELQLQAGLAHGIASGDQFLLSPLDSISPESGLQQGSFIAHVTNAEAFASSLKLLGTPSTLIKTGWIARHLTRSSLQKFRVHLDKTLPNQQEWGALLRKRSLATTTDSQFSFDIVLNSANECEILDDQRQRIHNTPTVVLHGEEGPNLVCDLVEHLARFKAVEALSNSEPDHLSSRFRQSFILDLSHTSGGRRVTINAGGLTEVQDGERARLLLENIGDDALYLFVYSMSSAWQIENVLRGAYDTIPPKNPRLGFGGKYEKRLKFTVPEEARERGSTKCQDILKVFVTSRPTSFDILELPALGEAPKISGIGDGRVSDDELSGDWEAFNFCVCTYIP